MRRALDRLASEYAATVGASHLDAPACAAQLVVEVAFHEAAHAVVGALAGLRPLLATVERGPPDLPGRWGFVRWITPTTPAAIGELMQRNLEHAPGMRRGLERRAMMCVAGHVMEAVRDQEHAPRDLGDLAERLESVLANESGAGDMTDALAALAPLEGDERRRWGRLLSLAQQTETLLRRPRIAAAVEQLAEALLDEGTVEGEALDVLLPPVRH